MLCSDSSTPWPDGSTCCSCLQVDPSRSQLAHGEFHCAASCKLLLHHRSATALQSVEIACDTILSGKAKVMIAGGFDDFSEEGSYEFANMKATSNTETEFAMGREPNEFSRPTTSTRGGVSHSQLHESRTQSNLCVDLVVYGSTSASPFSFSVGHNLTLNTVTGKRCSNPHERQDRY
jgi:hypothetical protein